MIASDESTAGWFLHGCGRNIGLVSRNSVIEYEMMAVLLTLYKLYSSDKWDKTMPPTLCAYRWMEKKTTNRNMSRGTLTMHFLTSVSWSDNGNRICNDCRC